MLTLASATLASAPSGFQKSEYNVFMKYEVLVCIYGPKKKHHVYKNDNGIRRAINKITCVIEMNIL